MLDLEIHKLVATSAQSGWNIYMKINEYNTCVGFIPKELTTYWWFDDPLSPNRKLIFKLLPEYIKLKLS